MSRHGQIAPLDDITDRRSHPEPAQITAIGNANLSLKDVLKTRGRKPGVPGGGRDRWPSPTIALLSVITNDSFDSPRYARINVSSRPGIRKINKVRDR
jgi:hypothetical protein